MDPDKCKQLLTKYDTFTSQFCIVDPTLQKVFGAIGIISCLGILITTACTIKKGFQKKKKILEPTGRHENETYCILSLLIIRLMISYLIIYCIFLTIQIIKLSLGTKYNYYYLTENQRSCDSGAHGNLWFQNVHLFVIIEFSVDTIGQTLQSLIILSQCFEWQSMINVIQTQKTRSTE